LDILMSGPDAANELFELMTRLQAAAKPVESAEIAKPLDVLEAAAEALKSSFSGSWLGYHAYVYYADLEAAPPGAHFSQEWGLKRMMGSTLGSRGNWEEFDPAEVEVSIHESAGKPKLKSAEKAAASAVKAFEHAKSEGISILAAELDDNPDSFLTKQKEDLEKLESLSADKITQIWSPSGQIIIRDMIAVGQGYRVPPHVKVLAEVASLRSAFRVCEMGALICQKAASHLERKSRKRKKNDLIGTNVFLGHGRSGEWRKLKDFLQDRLGLPWDEFNRVPVAGVTNIARLSEMLDSAAVAFIILTAEDEMADGHTQARMNVIHEAGLFQGRLGFTKAILLLEEGCSQFSNIEGLGQIRFAKGNIATAFEEIRLVLEREGLLS
jgi:predicted nucleotide-binding protein